MTAAREGEISTRERGVAAATEEEMGAGIEEGAGAEELAMPICKHRFPCSQDLQ